MLKGKPRRWALEKLGRGLHSLQDIDAHGNYGIQWKVSILKKHGPYYDNVGYDWADTGLVNLVKTKNKNGLGNRYNKTKSNSLIYMAIFRMCAGLDVPEEYKDLDANINEELDL